MRAKTTLTIHKLDLAVERRLRDLAARHRRSIEDEVRQIVQNVVGSTNDEPKNAYEAMRRHFRDLEGVDLQLPARRTMNDRSNGTLPQKARPIKMGGVHIGPKCAAASAGARWTWLSANSG